MTEGEMVGWHHRLDGHEFEQALGVGDGQGNLESCNPWGPKESDTTEQLNRTRWIQKLIPGMPPPTCINVVRPPVDPQHGAQPDPCFLVNYGPQGD